MENTESSYTRSFVGPISFLSKNVFLSPYLLHFVASFSDKKNIISIESLFKMLIYPRGDPVCKERLWNIRVRSPVVTHLIVKTGSDSSNAKRSATRVSVLGDDHYLRMSCLTKDEAKWWRLHTSEKFSSKSETHKKQNKNDDNMF